MLKALWYAEGFDNFFLSDCHPLTEHDVSEGSQHTKQLIQLDQKVLPQQITDTTSFASVEFAGVKFKSQASSGKQYLQNVERFIILPITFIYKAIDRIVICEEKYSFTPDDFKAATRQQRKKERSMTISHLKTHDEILSTDTFDRNAVKLDEGKALIGT